MITGVDGSGATDADCPQRRASVAAVTDVGPRRVNEDRSSAVLSETDGSWVIAVADGLGGHPRGDEAAQAAVEGLPTRIASQAEMVTAFADADRRVLALADTGSQQRRVHLSMLPMSTLCVAAWTPEGGLLIGWMGDTLPFILRAHDRGFSGFSGRLCGMPHRNPDGTIEACLGMPTGPPSLIHQPIEMEISIVSEANPAELPDGVVICSDGAWEPFVYAYGIEWLWDDSVGDGIGSACGPGAETADDMALRVLAGARRLGLNDNATVAAGFWR